MDLVKILRGFKFCVKFAAFYNITLKFASFSSHIWRIQYALRFFNCGKGLPKITFSPPSNFDEVNFKFPEGFSQATFGSEKVQECQDIFSSNLQHIL